MQRIIYNYEHNYLSPTFILTMDEDRIYWSTIPCINLG